MAGEQLLTTSDLLAGLPDNTSGLIEAVDARNMVISIADGVGFFDDNDDPSYPVTIPNAGLGVGVDILSALPAPPGSAFVANYYRLDANNHFVPSYVDEGITVPPGTFRLVNSTVGLVLSKPGGGTNLFTLQGTKAGVPYLPGSQVTLTQLQSTHVFSGTRLIDINLAEPLSMQFIPEDGPADLVVHEIRVNLRMVLV